MDSRDGKQKSGVASQMEHVRFVDVTPVTHIIEQASIELDARFLQAVR
jgi:hypothetical protein